MTCQDCPNFDGTFCHLNPPRISVAATHWCHYGREIMMKKELKELEQKSRERLRDLERQIRGPAAGCLEDNF